MEGDIGESSSSGQNLPSDAKSRPEDDDSETTWESYTYSDLWAKAYETVREKDSSLVDKFEKCVALDA
jgi:hypothetical protein